MGVQGSSAVLLVLSGLLAAAGVLQLVSLPGAAEPMGVGLAAFAALLPAGYFLGLYAALPKAEKPVVAIREDDGSAVVVPFRRRAQ
jgi:hypothetical protein